MCFKSKNIEIRKLSIGPQRGSELKSTDFCSAAYFSVATSDLETSSRSARHEAAFYSLDFLSSNHGVRILEEIDFLYLL